MSEGSPKEPALELLTSFITILILFDFNDFPDKNDYIISRYEEDLQDYYKNLPEGSSIYAEIIFLYSYIVDMIKRNSSPSIEFLEKCKIELKSLFKIIYPQTDFDFLYQHMIDQTIRKTLN